MSLLHLITKPDYQTLTAFFLRGNLLRSQALLVRFLFLLSVGILLTACASSSGRSNAFSHAAYNFVGLNTTLTSADAKDRILGMVRLDRAEVALNLPPSANASSISEADFRLEGSALAQQFYEVNGSGVVRFSATNDYRRVFSLGYVVDELAVSDFSVVANVSYATADGAQAQWVARAPVRVAAVGGDALSLLPNRFVRFSGLNRGLVAAPVNRSFTNAQLIANRSVAENDEVVFLSADSDQALVSASANAVADLNYTASAAEAEASFVDEDEVGVFNFNDLARDENVTQSLSAEIVLVLVNADGENARNATLSYVIDARTPLSEVNGNTSVSGSFLYALNQSDQDADEAYLNAAATGYGANVSAVRVSLRFGYTREVLEERAADALNQALRYRVSGSIEENSLGGRVVNGLGNVLSSLGIEARLPSDAAEDGYSFLPTLHYRLVSFEDGSEPACEDRYYVDHQSGSSVRALPFISAAAALDYEDVAGRASACRLQASLTGVEYEDVVTAANTDFSLARNLEGRTLEDNDLCENNVMAAREGKCRYAAEVNISLLDVNEAPSLILTARSAQVGEGDVGSVSRFNSSLVFAVAGASPVLTGVEKLTDLAFADEDFFNASSTNRQPTAGLPQIVSVVPSLPAGAQNLFIINASLSSDGNLSDREGTLWLNRAALGAVDYETLQASGHSGYRLRLQVRDTSAAGLTRIAEFELEIVDVVYKPIVVGSGYVSTADPAASVQRILPGFQQFAFNGGPVLGRLRAVDPESNSEAGIVYAYNARSDIAFPDGVVVVDNPTGARDQLEALIGANFAIIGDRLNLIGLGLQEVIAGNYPPFVLTAPTAAADPLPVDFNVTVRAFNGASEVREAAASSAIVIDAKVQFNATLSAPAPVLRFSSGAYAGVIAEGQVGDGTADGVAVLDAMNPDTMLNLTRAPAPTGVTAFYRLVSQEEALSLIGGLPSQVRASLLAYFAGEAALFDLSGSEQFAIDSATGRISLANGVELDFSQRSNYLLLAQVLPTLNATNSDLTAGDRFLLSDYAVVLVDVRDDNLEPELVNLRAVAPSARVNRDTATVFLTLKEGEGQPGQVLARLQARDDNPLPDALVFSSPENSLFRVERVSEVLRDETTSLPRSYGADYAVILNGEIDFESAGASAVERHIFMDNGVYRFDRQSGLLVNDSRDPQNATLVLSATIENVDEPLELKVTRDEAGTDEFGAKEARVLETAGVGSAQLVDEEGTAQTDQSVYIQLDDPDDPEGKIALSSAPVYRLEVPSALEGVVELSFNGSGPSGPYFQLNITDAAGLENAGDGDLFELSVYVGEQGVDQVSVSFALRIVNDLSQDTLVVLGALPGTELSEQRALEIYGRSASERTLLSGLFNLTAVHADYDEFFPDTNNRFVDLVVRRGAIAYPQDIRDSNLLHTDRFGLFEFAVAADSVGSVDLLLQEGQLIDPRLIGTSSNLTFGVSVEDRSSSSGSSAEVGTMMVEILPTASERVIFATASNTSAALEPPVFNFGYTQTRYAEALETDACEGAEARTNIMIEGRCYATIEIRDSSGERLNVVGRQARRTDQSVYTGDLAAVFRSTERPREFGVVLTDATLDLANLGVYVLAADGSLTETHDFAEYFELSVNQSYSGDNGAARPALVISQRVYPELNRSRQDSQQILSDGAEYLALDLLALNSTNPEQTLSYFVVAGEAGASERSATQRAIAQLNVEVFTTGSNEFLSELKINDVLLSSRMRTEITQAQLSDLLDAPGNALSFTLMNLDGDNDDDTLDQNVSVLLEVLNEEDMLVDGMFDAAKGTASGNRLIRLGANADDAILVNTELGDTSREFTGHPFQLARNVYGEAAIRVTLTEFEARNPDMPLPSSRADLYRIVVLSDNRTPAAEVTGVTIDGATSLTEDATALADGGDLSIVVTSADPSNKMQSLTAARLSIAATTIDGAAATTPVFRLSSEGPASAVTTDTVTVTQGLIYTEHGFGTTTFAATLTVSEPRGFDGVEVTFTPSEPVTIDFNVTSVNDPLEACGTVNCGSRRNLVADFAGDTDFSDQATVTKDVTIFLRDDDSLFESTGTTHLPEFIRVDNAAIVQTPALPAELLPLGELLQIGAPTKIEAVEPAGVIAVTLPVSVTLDADDVETLTDEGFRIHFSPEFRDSGDDDIQVTADAEIHLASLGLNGCGGVVGLPSGFLPLCSEETLAAVNNDLIGNYLLTEDIALEAINWRPLGDATIPFSGVFDGGGFVISDLDVSSRTRRKDAGLFGVIRDAQIRDLGIIAHNVTAFSAEDVSAGALAGRALNSNIRNVHINITERGVQALGVYTTTDTSLDATTDNGFNASSFVGGLIGKSVHSVIEDSSVSASAPIHAFTLYRPGNRDDETQRVALKASTAAVGGLVGWNVGAITNSFAAVGMLLAEGGYPQNGPDSVLYASAGGLVGEHHAGEIEGSYAVAHNITVDFINPQVFFMAETVGEPGNRNTDSGHLRFDNDISSFLTDRNEIRTAGGLIGRLAGDLNNSYALVSGDVSALRSNTTLSQSGTAFRSNYLSEAEAELFGRGRSSSAGGLIGDVFGTEARLENSYAIIEGALLSTVPGNALAGGLLGAVNAANTDPVGASYYSAARSSTDPDGTDFNNTFGGEREVDQLECASPTDTDCSAFYSPNDAFVGWNAGTIWDFGDVNTLPVLRNSPPCRSGEEDCRLP